MESGTTKNIRLTITYRGTKYVGWQFQRNGVSIEETLCTAIKTITGEDVTLYGSGRTDSGVHALAQVANFHTASSVPPEKFTPALNAHLPPDIRILVSEAVSADFHSRFSASGKAYRYQIDRGPVASPFYYDYAWHLPEALDEVAMNEAVAHFVGEHDFAAFMATGSKVKDTVRRIHSLDLERRDNLLTLEVRGSGFLYNMVRIIAGTLVAVGQGKLLPDEIPAIITGKDRSQAGITAPAKGLFLAEVTYPST